MVRVGVKALGRTPFERATRPHMAALRRLALRLTGNRDDAEELLQDVFTGLYANAATLLASDDPGPWLRRVVYRRFVDRWRLPGQGGRWTLHGRVAHVDRDDNAGAGFFASFSYDAIGVGVSHRRHVGGGRFLELDGHWRGTRYADEEVRAGATLDRRRESTVHLGGALEIPLGSRWQLITRLEGTRRTSSVDRFAYEQVRASAMIEREF